MTTSKYDIHFSRVERVYIGVGQVAVLRTELEVRGFCRALVATSRSLVGSAQLEAVVEALGTSHVGTFSGCIEHAGIGGVRTLVDLIRDTGADLLVAFGGGSVADTCKASRACVLTGRDPAELMNTNYHSSASIDPLGHPVEQISITTTLSAGEYSWGAGITDENGVKSAIIHPLFAPVAIINDPELAVDTPNELWLSTGMRAFDHGVEAIYSAYSSSFTNALARSAIELLVDHLEPSLCRSRDVRLAARGRCQEGAFLSNYASRNARYGFSHAIGHKAGPAFGIPHGMTSCIALPHAMRFVATIAPERFEPIACALRIPERRTRQSTALACADFVEDLVRRLGAPARLRDYQVSQEQIVTIVRPIHQEMVDSDAFGQPVTVEQIARVVEACW